MDAIPKGELNTARKLKENLEDLKFNLDNSFRVGYIRVETIKDIDIGIDSLIKQIKLEGLKPLLHLEGHGLSGENGFLTANKEQCLWSDFKKVITPVNIYSDFNVMLVLATFFGGSFARSIVTTDHAPVLGLIGPVKEIEAGHVEDGFIAFYSSLFETSSFKSALGDLNKATPGGEYFWTSAEKLFYDVWASYKENSCTKKEIYQRAGRIYQNIKATASQSLVSVGQIKRGLQNPTLEQEFF